MYKNNQSGKSMVEMLAVLAIMAVLSVTGIYAYNLAMTKHKANELIHKANLAYVDVISRDSLDSWTELKVKGIDGTPMQGVIYKDAGFVLIDNVDKDVCNTILNDKTNFSLMQTTNVAFTACETINSIVFDFANTGDFGAKCVAGKCPLESDGQYCSTNTNTCIMETNCPDGEWNFDIDACGTCESVNGELAPISSENGCISCAESTNDAQPIWDVKNKTCVNCVSDTDCEINSYCKNTICTNCPENSSVTVTSEQIGETSCYCNSGYITNSANNGCEPTLETKCSGGFVVTGQVNGQQYCVSNNNMSWPDANNWCAQRDMSLQNLNDICPNYPAYRGTCTNLVNRTSEGFCGWTKNYYGTHAGHKNYYYVRLSDGWVYDSNYYTNGTAETYALCQ